MESKMVEKVRVVVFLNHNQLGWKSNELPKAYPDNKDWVLLLQSDPESESCIPERISSLDAEDDSVVLFVLHQTNEENCRRVVKECASKSSVKWKAKEIASFKHEKCSDPIYQSVLSIINDPCEANYKKFVETFSFSNFFRTIDHLLASVILGLLSGKQFPEVVNGCLDASTDMPRHLLEKFENRFKNDTKSDFSALTKFANKLIKDWPS